MRQELDEFGVVAQAWAGRTGWDSPLWGRLSIVTKGAFEFVASGNPWRLSAGLGLWVPAGRDRKVAPMEDDASMTTLLVPGKRDAALEPEGWPKVLQATDLLREIVVRLAKWGSVVRGDEFGEALVWAAQVEVADVRSLPLSPPRPRSYFFARVADHLGTFWPHEDTIDEVALRAEMSRRALERRFHKETGLSVGDWRHEARLIESVRLLLWDLPQVEIARLVGYSSEKSFSNQFERRFGETPLRYRRSLLSG
ncbi:MAG: helix-turn-helix domain-containing protein [Fimbriimonadales bacterium]